MIINFSMFSRIFQRKRNCKHFLPFFRTNMTTSPSANSSTNMNFRINDMANDHINNLRNFPQLFGKTISPLRQDTKRSVQVWLVDEEGEPFVLKQLSLSDAAENELKCLQIVKANPHPNILEMYDHWEDKQYLYITMKYYPGGDLHDFVKENELTEGELRFVLFQSLDALRHLWGLGIVHRDISLENIMVDHQCELGLVVKIIDFDCAISCDPQHQEIFLPCIGKDEYIAPELYRCGEKLYPMSFLSGDIYSLGITMIMLLTRSWLYCKPTREDTDFQCFFYHSMIETLGSRGFIGSLSQECLEFLEGMTNMPENRLTLQEAKNHVWFENLNFVVLPDGTYQIVQT